MSTIATNPNAAMNHLPEDASQAERMRALIEAISAYIEHYHGGAVEMIDYKEPVLVVRMSGACDGCELAPVTLHGWVEGTVKQFFPEVDRVEATDSTAGS